MTTPTLAGLSPQPQAVFKPPPKVIHAAWIILFIACVGLYIQAIPARYALLRQITPTNQVENVSYQLAPTEAALLAQYDIPIELYAVFNLVFEAIQAAAFVIIAILLFMRRSNQLAVVFFSATLLLVGVISPATVRVDEDQPLLMVLEVLRLCFTVVFVYTFPDGRFVPAWTRWVSLVCSMGILALLVIEGGMFHWPPLTQSIMTLLWLGPCLAAQYYRFRHISTPEQRQQTRWFMFGMAIVISGSLLRGIIVQIAPGLAQPGPLRLLYHTLVAIPIFDTVLFLMLPISIGVSIARYRLYGLNLVINRWMVYGGAIGGLIFFFFLAFFVLRGAVQLVGGDPSLALVIATAICVALFEPARVRLQRFVDRRFFHLRLDLERLGADQRAKAASMREHAALTEKTLGAYKLGDLIGKGGMGHVYHAYHRTLERPVAVKVLSDLLVHDPNFRTRFEREAKAVAALNHPNIVRVFDLGMTDDETYYMAMEYIEGRELADIIQEEGVLPLERVCPIVHDVAAALDHAHQRGLVHRDVKPSNVMLRSPKNSTGYNGAVLMDFGIAKLTTSESNLTGSIMMGTLDYAAPEQIMSEQTLDGRADIYGLGVMTYYMLTGKLPFSGGIGQVVFAHLQQPAPDPRILIPDLPEYAALAVMRAMAKKPEDRFPTAAAFALALANASSAAKT